MPFHDYPWSAHNGAENGELEICLSVFDFWLNLELSDQNHSLQKFLDLSLITAMMSNSLEN